MPTTDTVKWKVIGIIRKGSMIKFYAKEANRYKKTVVDSVEVSQHGTVIKTTDGNTLYPTYDITIELMTRFVLLPHTDDVNPLYFYEAESYQPRLTENMEGLKKKFNLPEDLNFTVLRWSNIKHLL